MKDSIYWLGASEKEATPQAEAVLPAGCELEIWQKPQPPSSDPEAAAWGGEPEGRREDTSRLEKLFICCQYPGDFSDL